MQEAKKNLHTEYQITGVNFPERIVWCVSEEYMKLSLRMEKGALRQKDFMMCFSEYLENQDQRQTYLFTGEMSNDALSSYIRNAQFRILFFCFSHEHSPGTTVLPQGWGAFLRHDSG